MFELTCSNCGKIFRNKSRQRYKNCFCCKKCEAEFRKGKLTHPKKLNEIIIKDKYAIIKIQNNQLGKFDCLIDIEDVDKIKDYFWNVRYDKRHPECTVYVETHKNKKRIHLHRLLTNCPKDMVVDHIDGNGLNNRKTNLRVVTQRNNCINRTLTKRNLPIGVYKDKRSKSEKYIVMFMGKYIGRFKNIEEASNAYSKAKNVYFSTIYKNAEINQQLHT